MQLSRVSILRLNDCLMIHLESTSRWNTTLGTSGFQREELAQSYGAMAEQLGSGLQNRVHRCDSGSRLN